MPRDPFGTHNISNRLGNAGIQRGASNARWELGVVTAYHAATHSVDVHTIGHGRDLSDVAQIKANTGSYDLLEVGTTVVVSWDLGFMPLIVGVLDIVGQQLDPLGNTSITGTQNSGVDDPLQPTQGGSNYRPTNAPPDLMGGDRALLGDYGHGVSVLKGGISHLGCPTAHVRSLGLSGLLEFFGQKMRAVSDWGIWDITNEAGKTSFRLRAGSDQATETGYDEEHWTIALDLGATGDVFNFEIMTPEGQSLFRFFVDASGHFQIYGAGGGDISSGPDAGGVVQDHQGDHTVSIGGNATETISGNAVKTIDKKVTESVGTDKSTVIGNDESRMINRNRTLNVGGLATEVVAGGSAQDAKSSTIAKNVVLLNGGYVIDIGDPAKGANVSAKAGFALKTAMGDVTIDSGGALTMKAKQVAQLDGSQVKFGNGDYALPKWPTFRQDLYQFLTLLIVTLQSTSLDPGLMAGVAANVAQFQMFTQKLANSGSYDSSKSSTE